MNDVDYLSLPTRPQRRYKVERCTCILVALMFAIELIAVSSGIVFGLVYIRPLWDTEIGPTIGNISNLVSGIEPTVNTIVDVTNEIKPWVNDIGPFMQNATDAWYTEIQPAFENMNVAIDDINSIYAYVPSFIQFASTIQQCSCGGS